jgi:environmental stress-induced protein Ves
MTQSISRRVDSVPLQPWKNGGGFARELAAGDGWRISLAGVERDAAFSVYEGVTRHSVVVSGAGLRLRDGAETLELARFDPVRYDGGRAWHATLLDGPVQVLNVMVDAHRWVARLHAGSALDDREPFAACLVLPFGSGCTCSIAAAMATAIARDEFLCHAPPGMRHGISVRSHSGAAVAAISHRE